MLVIVAVPNPIVRAVVLHTCHREASRQAGRGGLKRELAGPFIPLFAAPCCTYAPPNHINLPPLWCLHSLHPPGHPLAHQHVVIFPTALAMSRNLLPGAYIISLPIPPPETTHQYTFPTVPPTAPTVAPAAGLK